MYRLQSAAYSQIAVHNNTRPPLILGQNQFPLLKVGKSGTRRKDREFRGWFLLALAARTIRRG